MDINPNQEIRTFVAESRYLLQNMEDALLRIESGGGSEEDVSAICRAANMIRDTAWLFSFAHEGGAILEHIS